MTPDISTLMLVLALTTVISVVGLLVASFLNRQIVAIRYWAGGLTVFIPGLLWQVFSPPLPLWISAVIITQAYFILWWGTRCYRFGQAQPQFFKVMLLLCLIQGSAFFAFQDSLRISIMIHSAVVVGACLVTMLEAVLMRLRQRALLLAWVVLWGAHATVYCRRFLLYALDPAYAEVTSMHAASSVEAVNYLEGIAFIYGFSLICFIFTTLRLQQALRRQATRDPLTDLLNRRAFEETSTRLLAQARRFRRPLSVLLMDLDRFKSINDQHGHKAGDLVLQAFAGHLGRHLRATDLSCRYGGEEFVVLLPDTDLAQARELSERVREAWQRVPLDIGTTNLAATVSIGLASVAQGDAHVLDDLIERADHALYRAKQLGRNRSHVWQEGLRLASFENVV
ncbi:diguanylate cyclase (GGDEF) domain-containing protein [Halopseudomonas xinjiangensis]|uniref:diguanylate cyclase n=1 Tax=Halopseudomonas xinjiangensis TaxID=487184 RepID=A0A1H1R883_9GAMM|nr:GGDEF domain-containing protein [Halopseudomonas xinjiangensis]SDS31855.1 diguanylate cyclase (GGDEF) domain-containing protein [Halopseudomonas xinjiangensis]